MTTHFSKWLLAALAAVILAGCSGGEQEVVAKPDPVHFESGDECHVCGMVITNFPGPKGQAFTEREQHTRKFCSTKDMFAWFLQPENENRDHTLYVHNMAQTDWEHPDDTHLIDAREAFYVAGSERTGAMGPTWPPSPPRLKPQPSPQSTAETSWPSPISPWTTSTPAWPCTTWVVWKVCMMDTTWI